MKSVNPVQAASKKAVSKAKYLSVGSYVRNYFRIEKNRPLPSSSASSSSGKKKRKAKRRATPPPPLVATPSPRRYRRFTSKRYNYRRYVGFAASVFYLNYFFRTNTTELLEQQPESNKNGIVGKMRQRLMRQREATKRGILNHAGPACDRMWRDFQPTVLLKADTSSINFGVQKAKDMMKDMTNHISPGKMWEGYQEANVLLKSQPASMFGLQKARNLLKDMKHHHAAPGESHHDSNAIMMLDNLFLE